jgi:hypothetical protein
MRPSIDPQSVPPPKDSSVFSVGTGIGVGLGLLVGAGAGILLGRTWLAPKQSTTTAFPTSSPPATTRLNPGGGLKDAFLQDNNVIHAPGLKRGEILQKEDCWETLFRFSPLDRAAIVWAVLNREYEAGRFIPLGEERAHLEYQMEVLRAHAYDQTCHGVWPPEESVRARLGALASGIRGTEAERRLCEQVRIFASGGSVLVHDFRFDCTAPASTPGPVWTNAPPSTPATADAARQREEAQQRELAAQREFARLQADLARQREEAQQRELAAQREFARLQADLARQREEAQGGLRPPPETPVPNVILTDFDACQRAFAALTIAQQGRVADEMLRYFGFSGYVQVEGDAALGARLREVSQAARAKVGSTTLQPKMVNARLRALRVALSAAGQDRRDAFCQLVADAPRTFKPGGALDPLSMSFPLRR